MLRRRPRRIPYRLGLPGGLPVGPEIVTMDGLWESRRRPVQHPLDLRRVRAEPSVLAAYGLDVGYYLALHALVGLSRVVADAVVDVAIVWDDEGYEDSRGLCLDGVGMDDKVAKLEEDASS